MILYNVGSGYKSITSYLEPIVPIVMYVEFIPLFELKAEEYLIILNKSYCVLCGRGEKFILTLLS